MLARRGDAGLVLPQFKESETQRAEPSGRRNVQTFADTALALSPMPSTTSLLLEDSRPPESSTRPERTLPDRLPTRGEVRAAIPDHCFERSTTRSFAWLGFSLAIVAALVAGAAALLPLSWAWAPVWVLYSVATGTAATGLWVIAHECGHGAFSRHDWVQNTVGFVLHSALLVPYFSWQRSHAVHHAKTNHLDEGETHVPKRITHANGRTAMRLRARLGRRGYTLVILVSTLLFGWPLYLLAGATAGPARRRANHFWPAAPFRSELFPDRWVARVWMSSLGVLAAIALLITAGATFGWGLVAALYVGPYLVTNAWLVLYTWLQHTDSDVPHFGGDDWSWMLGAFQTIDRPYPAVIDRLHHHIGTTHVLHHIDHRVPHYHAREATEALKAAFPEWYRFNPTPIARATWQVAGDCVAVDLDADHSHNGWTFNAAERS